MNATPAPKEITDYFRHNIFEAISAYNGWKMLTYSKSKAIVSEKLAERYLKIQNFHTNFFISAARSFLVNFVIMILHSFDGRDDSFSLYKADQQKTTKFVEQNKDVLEKLKKVRCKIFAHRDIKTTNQTYELPSIMDLDNFFKNIIVFYNEITSSVDNSSTMFGNAEGIKRDIELLFMNLERGEASRKLEIDIEWAWDKDSKKASDVL